MVKISARVVSGLRVAIPQSAEQELILNSLAAGDARLRAEIESVSLLRDLKSGLMDDLLTGRVRVTPLLESAVA
jgi:type I restriction enzyme S subunit